MHITIEEYHNDLCRESCPISGKTQKERIIHIVCSPKDEYLVIITTYIPDINKWDKGFKTRIK
ncbi:MAG: hypothetical protein CVT88_05020 [Candidatus Altiarchaeales archaeon HGW-Altiarchaeales-1]|nr:MAG: hypothetical protein CVT88_05020 [Candidatus Altiarchaeales archaeon HGW-Altiarchaeales-1]